MLRGGWKNIQNSTPDCKLSASCHHVYALVGNPNKLQGQFWKQVVLASCHFKWWVVF